ncbi:hypothetical protein FACS1894101_0560 [Betaproteobacteria bacterium]|nr:hypothetical protein FACS1894101_0560 [Betaproteobacteria bacterium]
MPAVAQSQWRDLGASPAPAVPTTAVNTTQINFGGHEWVVIGNTSKDIYTNGGAYGSVGAAANSVTLLLRNGDEGGYFDGSAFRLYLGSGSGGCYSDDYAGDCVSRPNEYQGSTLQDAMNGIANGLSDKEQNEINARTLTTADGIYGNPATGLLWALSTDEQNAIGNNDTRKYPSEWWLRSPLYAILAFAEYFGGDGTFSINVGAAAAAVRPAFNLALQSVLFASDARTSGDGKSAAAAGGDYQPLTLAPTAARKFTFRNTSIAAPALTLKSTPLDFDFSGVSTGANQYLSGFLSTPSGDLYAKYTQSASGSLNPTSTGDFPTANGNYELHIFSEEANTYLYSDFASEALDFAFAIDGGTVENLTLTSDSPFTLNGGTIGLLPKNYTKAWTLTGSGTFDIQSSVTAQISGTIGGSGALTKDGAGTLTLSGNNNYNGGTTVNAGLINFANAGNFGATGKNITLNGGGLQWATGNTTDISGKLTDLGVNGGTFDTNGNNVTLASVISGNGRLTKDGAGTLTLSNTNTYNGGTSVNAGLINFANAGNFGATGKNITLNGGGLQWATGNTTDISGKLTDLGANGGTFDTNGNDVTLATAISGTDSSLTKDGAGKLTLIGANDYSGVTTINAGTLALSGNGSIEDSSGVTLADVSGAIFDISSVGGSGTTIKGLIGGGASGGNVTLGSKNLTVNNGGANSYGGVISGNGSLTKDGAGTLMLSNTNNYDGGTTVNAGLINFANADNFGTTGTITLNGGGLQWATGNITDISGKLTDLGANGGTFDTNGNDVTLANIISGTGKLTKTGDGILELTGTNTYNGGTTVSGGTLKGNTTSLQGDIFNNANVEFAQATNGTYAGTMSGSGSLTKTGNEKLTLTNFGNSYSGDTTVSAGTLEVTGLLGNGNYGGDIANYGALIFNQTSHQALSGEISGNGSLTKDNTGTLILNGTNNYSAAESQRQRSRASGCAGIEAGGVTYRR